MYLPLDELEKAQLKLEDLRANEISPALKQLLQTFGTSAEADLSPDMSEPGLAPKAYLRPLLVLAALHKQLVKRIGRSNYDVASQRMELGPVEKPWIAWRAARKAG
jgi:phytoene synthase